MEPFVPPRKKFDLLMVTLDLDYVKAGTKGDPVDAPQLAKKLQGLLSRHVRPSHNDNFASQELEQLFCSCFCRAASQSEPS